MTDHEFLRAFEACTLTRAEWTHEAHIRMAWLYSRREATLEGALARMRAGIPRLNAALDTDASLYHETVTCAFGTAVFKRATAPEAAESWPAFCNGHPELFDRSAPLLHRHYEPETLKSDAARLTYVPPDRAPL